MEDRDLLDPDAPRPNLVASSNMDDLLELYESIMSELDSLLDGQKKFVADE